MGENQRMKRITRIEEGFLINDFQHRQITKNSISLLRSAILNLVHIGRLTHKEARALESEIDKVLYKEKIKK